MTTTATATTINPACATKIEKSYAGASGKCCCGCAGKYSENPRTIKAAMTRANKMLANGGELSIGSCYIAVDLDSRVTILYFDEAHFTATMHDGSVTIEHRFGKYGANAKQPA
jgi:hypothetical protein